MSAVVRMEGIEKTYEVGGRPLRVLQGLELTVAKGELVGIMGASGSGKSTLLNIIGILDYADSGEYWLAGEQVRDLNENDAARMRNRTIGFVFQSFHLLPFKNAVENVALPLYYAGVPRKDRQQRALAMLERVGLADWREHLPTELSGGQKQRVAVARALVTQPALVLADEPTGALDSVTSGQIMELFEEIHADGQTVVIVTHEREIAERMERVIALRDGQVVEHDLTLRGGR